MFAQIHQWLNELDKRNFKRFSIIWKSLRKLDQWSNQNWRSDKKKFSFLKTTVWNGGSKELVKKRTGLVWLDKLSAIWYYLCQKLDKLDTMFVFPGRPYQAKVCRVRSKSEKMVANWLTENGFKFKYEKPLVLGVENSASRFMLELLAPVCNQWLFKQLVKQCGGVLLHPDFYLTDYGVYLEYWGLADSDPVYNRNHHSKLALYSRHQIPIISLYPRHLREGLDKVFASLFKQTTGNVLPKKERR